MPFRRRARVHAGEPRRGALHTVYYQITYTLEPVEEDRAYFHAQFHRANPCPISRSFPILDKIQGRGLYAGTYMAWGVHNSGWWGEGEIKFFLDGDEEFPTICGTGTEDYFCGSYNFENQKTQRVPDLHHALYGPVPVLRPDGVYPLADALWPLPVAHPDPIAFSQDIRVTIQALGWRSGGRYLPLQDDISAVAYFYLDKPAANLTPLPSQDELEII